MEVRFSYTGQDFSHLMAFIEGNSRHADRKASKAQTLAMTAFATVCMVSAAKSCSTGVDKSAVVVTGSMMILAILIFAVVQLVPRRAQRRRRRQLVQLPEQMVSVMPSGIHWTSGPDTKEIGWPDVTEFCEDANGIYLLADTDVWRIIPKRAFGSIDDVTSFYETAKQFIMLVEPDVEPTEVEVDPATWPPPPSH